MTENFFYMQVVYWKRQFVLTLLTFTWNIESGDIFLYEQNQYSNIATDVYYAQFYVRMWRRISNKKNYEHCAKNELIKIKLYCPEEFIRHKKNRSLINRAKARQIDIRLLKCMIHVKVIPIYYNSFFNINIRALVVSKKISYLCWGLLICLIPLQ